jgi:methyl-accepting chemotaxis protein
MRDALAGTKDSTLMAALRSAMPALDAYLGMGREVTELALKDHAAGLARQPEFNAAFGALEERMDVVGKSIVALSDVKAVEGARAAATARWTIVAMSLVAFCMIGLLCYQLASRISRAFLAVAERAELLRVAGLAPLERASTALAHGDLSGTIEVDGRLLAVDSDDEIGAMARSINAIVAQTQASANAFAEARSAIERVIGEVDRLVAGAARGELDTRADAQHHLGAYRELVGGMNRMLDTIAAPLDDATASLELVAACDLTTRMQGQYHGQFSRVADALNSAAGRLHDVLSDVQASAEQVASAGRQIADGSTSLAHDASEQASTLSQVAVRLRGLAQTSTRNVEGVREAQSVVGASRTQAEAGMQSMERLSDAMSEIQRSSGATAKVVKTIEEIAFQTNLLALNAAVEAARAGDAGKGFAVVADEVRNLAMRSAEAAKSTAQLIDDAVRHAGSGAALNAEVMQALQSIQSQVIRATEVMTLIGDGSREQAAGVDELDGAVRELGALVQRGAASAEESAASAEELQAQSATLAGLVNEFTLARSTWASSDHTEVDRDEADFLPRALTPRRAGAAPSRALSGAH